VIIYWLTDPGTGCQYSWQSGKHGLYASLAGFNPHRLKSLNYYCTR